MGRVKDNNMSGAIGPVVFYVVRGKMFGRIKPGERTKKPTPEMEKRNTLFGEITGPSSRMLKLIKRNVLFPIGFDEYNKLRGWMYILYCANRDKPDWEIKADNNLCQINPLSDLRQFFKPNITVSPNGSEGIAVGFASFNPVKDLRVPIKTKKVNIKIMVTTSLPDMAAPYISQDLYSFELTDTVLPAKEFILKIWGKKGDIVIATIAIEFERNVRDDKPDPRWLPAAVIAMGRL